MKKIVEIGVFLITVIFITILYFSPSEDQKPTNMTEIPKSVDISTLVKTSISSAKKQNKLLVLSTELNGVARSSAKEMGMEAWQIDIGSAGVQYFLDLSKLNAEKSFVSGNEIIVVVPRSALQVNQLPLIVEESYDNGSWLFTWRSQVKDYLIRQNKAKMIKTFSEQADQYEDLAFSQASVSLATLLNHPIKAAELPYTVIVKFEGMSS